MEEIFQFLYQLERNNNKTWFDEHRAEYEKTRKMLVHLTEILINEIQTFDDTIGYVNPKDCIFRIFRDLRFSEDKRPYKTNYGTFICKGGRNSGLPGYYVHFQPGQSFIAGGMYMPNAEQLRRIRTSIYEQPESFLEIIEDPEFKEFTLFEEGKLKLPPKGFPSDFEYIDWLKYRTYSPGISVDDKDLCGENAIDFILSKFKKMFNFNRFLTEAIGIE